MKYPSKEFFLAVTVFSKELTGVYVGTALVDVYQILIAAAGFMLFIRPERLPGLVAVLVGVTAYSAGLFALYDYPVTTTFVRQTVAVSFIYLGLAAFMMTCSAQKLAVAYINVCYLAAIFGLVQFCLSAAGINLLILLPLRLDSFAAEPSHYAVAMAPCVYYCFRYCRSLRAKRRAAVILGSVVLTVSTTAVAVLSVAFALAFYSRRGILVALLLIVGSPFLMMVPAELFPDVIASRLVDMDAYIESAGDPWETNNLTVLSFVTNFEVMSDTMRNGRLLGNGFCGHAVAYDRLFGDTEFVYHKRYGMNAPAAHCLLIRIVSEFGVPGALVLGLTFWHFVTNRRADIWCMFFIMAMTARALKLGSWIDYGLPLFVLGTVYMSSRAANPENKQRQAKSQPRYRSRTVHRDIRRRVPAR
jgi:hypothetical protein